MRILLKAHDISPLRGSECSNGWNFILNLSGKVALTVVHAKTNQFGTIDYEKEISNSKISNVNFIPISQPRITKVVAKINFLITRSKRGTGIPLLYFLGLYFWEKKVYKYVKNNINPEEIDIIHNLNHITFREPGFWYKINKPLVWGPVSGIGNIPSVFLNGIKAIGMNHIRNLSNYYSMNFSSRIKKNAQFASKIYSVSKEDITFFKRFNKNVSYLPDVAIEKIKEFSTSGSSRPQGKIHLTWIGRIDRIKSLDIFLGALGKLNEQVLEGYLITIIGEGPDKIKMQSYAENLGLKNILWRGQLERSIVLEILDESDLLVHTSVKEASATVILEALSTLTPIICHDAFGMSNLINDNIGFKLNYVSKKQSVDELKLILEYILANPSVITKKQSHIIEILEKYSYQEITKTIYRDYEDIINSL